MKEVSAEQLTVDFRNGTSLEESIKSCVEKYNEYGCFLAKGLFGNGELEETKQYLEKLVRIRLDIAGKEPNSSDGVQRFDDGFAELVKEDRTHGSVVFDACRRLLPLHSLSVDRQLVELAKALIGGETLIASDVKAIRVDFPEEDKYLFGWHQDYPYVMDSEDAVVFWIPLHDVDEHNGAITVAPGSNQLGLLPLRILDENNSGDNKQKFMDIDDKEAVNRFPHVRVDAEEGDVLAFNTLTLHKSGANTSSRARWTAQVRMGNFEHPLAIKRNWPGSLRDGTWFHETHPEYIV